MSNNSLEKLLLCPKCNQRAEAYTIFTIKKMTKSGEKFYDMIYLRHYSKEDRKTHKWFFAPKSEENLKFLKKHGISAFKEKIVLDKDVLNSMKRYWLWRKNYSKEDREIAKKMLSKLLSAEKIIVFLHF